MARQNKRRAFDKIKNFGTTIGPGTEIHGDFTGEDNCVVHGTVKGNCRLDGSLVVSDSGRWTGDIYGVNVLLAGEVEGSVTALHQLEILPTARVTGSIACPKIAIAEGAVHRGEMRMSHTADVTHFEERRSARGSD
jgi:cytoskeletal protein CcmA (bactofilin family)